MSERPLHIMSVNAHRSNAVVHGLLHASPFDILLIQEPWFGTIHTSRDDHDPAGVTTAGVAHNNMWASYLPEHGPDDVCKVAIYVRVELVHKVLIRPRHDLLSHPNFLIIDLVTEYESLRLYNVYHCVPSKGHGLHPLLEVECEPTIPTIVAGDFNTHNRAWSLPQATPSRWADRLDTWVEDNDLFLLNPPHVATWHGREDQRPSILDLVFINSAAVVSDQVSDVSVSFEASLGSDHAGLSLFWSPVTALPDLPPSTLPGFAIEDDLQASWSKAFALIPLPEITDLQSLQSTADRLLDDINGVCATMFRPRKTPDPKGVRWWNVECSTALAMVTSCQGQERQRAAKAFRITLADAKRAWGEALLHQTDAPNLWQATRWRHGRKSSRIAPLRLPSGASSHAPRDMEAALSARFFPVHNDVVHAAQPDDPPPLPPRADTPIILDEISAALTPTSNRSAPGLSGINYKLLKWASAASPDRLLSLFNACLTFGFHPWRSAKVIPIPKPNKKDYSLPKAYRPISLLECCGKLLEKIIANRVLSDINLHNLLPQNQFGSRDGHCAVDAALALTHTAQQGLRAGFPVAALLFDIQGFFDNMRRERAVHLFRILGFPPKICEWLSSFLTDRTVTLVFNNFVRDPMTTSDGTPQGSPLSPILSAIYTFPLLRLAELWEFCSLQLFVDDGAITASGATFRSAAATVARHYEIMSDWLLRSGLRTDPDKTEFIPFYNSRLRIAHGAPVSCLGLRNAAHGELAIRAATSVRYLGVFIHSKLKWDTHVDIMSARARSTVRALQLLGNSIRGLDFANWRKVFHAIILPVLTYGSPIWFNGHRSRQKTLLHTAQVAQNDAIRRIAGCFRTTPIDPLHHLLAIPPLPYTLEKLHGSYSDRLARLPFTHALRVLATTNTAAHWSADLAIPSSLMTLLPTSFHAVGTPAPPYARSWTHPRVRPPSATPPSAAQKSFARNLLRRLPPSGLTLIIRLLPHPDSFISAFLLYNDGRLVYQGWRQDKSGTGALLKSLVAGLELATSFHTGSLKVFSPNRAINTYLFNLSKHKFLLYSSKITSYLSEFLDFLETRVVDFLWYSTKWVGLPGSDAFQTLQEEAHRDRPLPRLGNRDDHRPLPCADMSRKDLMYSEWKRDFTHLPRIPHHAWVSCQIPDGNRPPPYILGLLTAANRRYWSAGIQLTNRHCFDADYSYKFRPNEGDECICPCSYLDDTALPNHDGSDDGHDRDSPSGARDGNDHVRLITHTVKHVLTSCPLTATLRQEVLLNRGLPAIFGSEAGGYALCLFLHQSQLLLCPLPPRPDPP
jgi:Reverse transcriptase (RNA-dependent DNA polymerase)/Endonuclease-reverse transcriptase